MKFALIAMSLALLASFVLLALRPDILLTILQKYVPDKITLFRMNLGHQIVLQSLVIINVRHVKVIFVHNANKIEF